MAKPNNDPSIHLEPHLQGVYELDPREARAVERVDLAAANAGLDEHMEHSVWEEVALSPNLSSKAPKDALTYANWLAYRISQTGRLKSWVVSFLLALSAGPWSLYGTFVAMLSGSGSRLAQNGALAITVFGPLVEELMKLAAVLWVVEKRPYFFKSRFQIGICALCSAAFFATLENLLYLNVYIQNPTAGIIYWRWTVCTALHVSCTCIGSIGLMRMWKATHDTMTPPRLSLAAPFLVTGVVIHGIYNSVAMIIAASGYQW